MEIETKTAITDLLANSSALEHQIAGRHSHYKNYALLNCNDGTLLKPVQHPPRGPCEVQFYEDLYRTDAESNPDLYQLRQFVPTYHGLIKSNFSKDPQFDKYLRLTNEIHQFKKPCVIDIKVGRVTYDPEASTEKINKELTKYPFLVGVDFIVLGMKIYQNDIGQYVFYDHFFGRSLTKETMLNEGIGKFFGLPGQVQHGVVISVLHKLRNLLRWFRKQRQLSFYASSLLIAYEGQKPEPQSMPKIDLHNVHTNDIIVNNADVHSANVNNDVKANSCMKNHTVNKKGLENVSNDVTDSVINDVTLMLDQNDDTSNHHSNKHCINGAIGEPTVVKMIDFTHVYPTQNIDQNYVYGLTSLIGHLEALLDIK